MAATTDLKSVGRKTVWVRVPPPLPFFMNIKSNKVTRFMDMHSGGKLKTSFTHIYIDQPLKQAVKTFKETFQRDPNNVTCKCCGEDYVYEEYDSLEEATAYDRGCEWNDHGYDHKTANISLEEYFSGENKVIFIHQL